MIETAMLVALGFLAATLLAVLALPLASRRAARLASLQLQDTLPMSVDEIAAERDGIRATSAVEQRRLEQKAERAAALTASVEAELGRRTAEVTSLRQAREDDRIERAALSQDMDRLQLTVDGTAAQLADLRRRADELETRLQAEEEQKRAVQGERDRFDALAEERRGAVASLETRCAGLEARLSDRTGELDRERGTTARLGATLSELTRERDTARHELLRAGAQRAMLEGEAKHLAARSDSYRDRLQAGAETLARTERLLMEKTAEHKAAVAALADLRRRFELLERRLIEVGGVAAQTLVDTEMDALRAAVAGTADEALRVLAHPEPQPEP